MNHARSYRWVLAFTGALVLGACATTPAMQAGQGRVSLTDAQAGQAQGSRVVWGGQLAKAAYVGQRSCFVVKARPLVGGARPNGLAPSPGFFVACRPGKYDQSVFVTGSYMTVTGTVEGTVEHMVGAQPQVFPMVAINHVYLWRSLSRSSGCTGTTSWHAGCYP